MKRMVRKVVSGRRVKRVAGPALAALMTLAAPAAPAQSLDRDVPYVPTPQDIVDLMLEMGEAGPGDVHHDLGSGDGRIVITAVRDFDVMKSVGIDIDPRRIQEARANAREAGVTDRATFIQGDLFRHDFSDADVLTLYLLPSVNMKLRPKILSSMEPGTHVVSHDFDMGDWMPDAHETRGRHNVFMWVVPARVDGAWRGDAGDVPVAVNLRQTFQKVRGSVEIFGTRAVMRTVVLEGRSLTFDAVASRDGTDVPVRFEGTASPDGITGTIEIDGLTRPVTFYPLG